MVTVDIQGNWSEGLVLVDAQTESFGETNFEVYFDGVFAFRDYIPFPCFISHIHSVDVRTQPKQIQVFVNGKELHQ